MSDETINAPALEKFWIAAVAAGDERRIDMARKALAGDRDARNWVERAIVIDDRDKWRTLAEKLAPEKTEAIDKAIVNEREGCARLAGRLACAELSDRLEDKFTELDAREVEKRVGDEIRKRGS